MSGLVPATYFVFTMKKNQFKTDIFNHKKSVCLKSHINIPNKTIKKTTKWIDQIYQVVYF